MKPEALTKEMRDLALDALDGTSLPELAIRHYDMGFLSANEVSDAVMEILEKAAPDILRKYPAAKTVSRLLPLVGKDIRRQLVLAVKTKVRGIR